MIYFAPGVVVTPNMYQGLNGPSGPPACPNCNLRPVSHSFHDAAFAIVTVSISLDQR